jgi:ABC-type Fe3+-siderophore transport system permease subunit
LLCFFVFIVFVAGDARFTPRMVQLWTVRGIEHRMNATSPSIDSELAKSLSEKSDQELIGILQSPTDWKPEVVDFARSELGRRSVSTARIEQTLAEKTKQKDEELQKRSSVPLTFWESFLSVLFGATLTLFGLIFAGLQASRFNSEGYILKSKWTWRLYWLGFGVWLAVVVIYVWLS